MLPILLLMACDKSDPGETSAPPSESAADSMSPQDSDLPEDEEGFEFSFEGERPTNLLMISIDTLRKDVIGRYSGDQEASPLMDQLMSEGVTFDQHLSCSNWTLASMVCALTGQTTTDLGYEPFRNGTSPMPTPPEITWLAEHLKEQGFQTSMVSTNPFLSNYYKSVHGYDRVIENNQLIAAEVLELGLEFHEAFKSEPWFLHLHIIDPHKPYDPPEEYLTGIEKLPEIPINLETSENYYAMEGNWDSYSEEEQENIKQHLHFRYQRQMRYLDDAIRFFMDQMEKQGVLENTLVVAFSDHGEQLYDHGGFTHGVDVYQEENDAFMFFWSRHMSAQAVTHPTTHTDMVPAILEILEQPSMEGTTGLPLRQIREDRVLFFHNYQPDWTWQGVLRNQQKLVFNWEGRWGLYDRSQDPQEQHDRLLEDQELTEELWELLQGETQRILEQNTGYTPDLSDYPY